MSFAHRRIAAALFSIVAVFTGASAQSAETNQDMMLSIDCGRLLAMLGQVSILMKLQDEDVSVEETPVAQLAAAVFRYSQLRRIACERALIENPQCSVNYAPRFATSAAGLRAAAEDAEMHIRPFWEAICRKLDDPAHPICQME